MNQRYTYVLIITLISVLLFSGWGKTGHSKVNYYTTIFFPSEMSAFAAWNSSLSSHASDADTRKNSDPTEDTKHFIDIDSYNEFTSTGKIPQDINVLITKYGRDYVVNKIGILPWATINTFDSLTSTFKRRDWNKALLFASDLGHYVGDGHMPLHITKNYNGQLTGQTGIHTPRYESTMIDRYSSEISIIKDTISYVSNVPDFVFNYIYNNYLYVDSILAADKYATSIAGNTSSTDYYQALWNKTKTFTNLLLNNASKRLAALMYTAWIDAGKPDLNSTFVNNLSTLLNGFEVYQNYPNPFNPETKIKFSVPAAAQVTLKVFDAAGREIKTLVNEIKPAGVYECNFNAQSLPSGIYFYSISFGNYSSTKKMVLMK